MPDDDSYITDHFKGVARELWSHNASWWQDGFTDGADPEYTEQILPIVGAWTSESKRILELGTGEGQILRYLEKLSPRDLLVGVDPTHEQIQTATLRGGGANYVLGEAQAVGFKANAFDTVVICLVLEHVQEISIVFAEIKRLLDERGSCILLLNHPLFQTPDSGWIDDQSFGDQYWRIGRYLESRIVVEEVEKDVFIPFVHRPLSHYLNTARACGLYLAEMIEPPPPQGFLDLAPEYYEARFIPRLLALRFEVV